MTFNEHTAPVKAVAFTKGGNVVVSASIDGESSSTLSSRGPTAQCGLSWQGTNRSPTKAR